MDKFLYDYINSHLIVKISDNYRDIIVNNPYEFVAFLEKTEFFISEILWFDRAKIEIGSSIGYGGPIDNQDNNFFWAETYICDTFSEQTTTRNYQEYLKKTAQQYSDYSLYPAFTLNLKAKLTQQNTD